MAAQTDDVSRSLRELTIPLYQARGWMKLLAVLLILGGVLTALTIWGILIAWLPIWGGVVLFQVAGALEEGQLAEGRTQAYERAFAKLKTFFVLMGVFNLIWIVLTALGLLFGLGMMAFMGEEMGPGMMGPRF